MTRRELIAALLAGPVVGMRAVQAATQTSSLTSLTVAEAIAQIAARTITPLQLTDAYLERIAAMNPSLNAFITITADHARAQARRIKPNPTNPSNPSNLFGIPIAHKDLLETVGVRTTAGSRLFDEHIPTTNAAVVQQLERAGAIMLGKTNTHELGGGVTTINPFFGTTRNPADLTRIPGGSSGGSAAAVVARMCAAATGSDTGGSVRIPAAFCGCVGFKPTYGRISTAGLLGSCPTFDHIGFLTRTVEDAQIMYGAALGTSTTSSALPGGSLPTSSAPPTSNSLPSGTRVGVARDYFFDDLEPVVSTSVSRAIDEYRALGASVSDVRFPIDAQTMSRVFDPIVVFEIWSRFGADWRATPSLFSPAFAGVFQSERPTVLQYETAQAALTTYQSQVDRLFDQFDVILTPTVPITAPPITVPIDGGKILRNTWPFNAAGTPTISIPLPNTSLPVGLQLIGRRGEDDKLLRVAKAFEGLRA